MRRRTFLTAASAGIAAACSGLSGEETPPETAPTADSSQTSSTTPPSSSTTTSTTIPFETEDGTSPFGLGVASGDPTTDAVVIWTRLVDGITGNPVFEADVEVDWFVTTRPGDPSAVVASGTTVTDVSVGHSVHVDVQELEPGSTYFFWFEAQGSTSPVGRARTVPTDPKSLRVVAASCQHYEEGFFGAWHHAAAEGADLAVMLGDMIYVRSGTSPTVRSHGSEPPTDLDGLRRRWALYVGQSPMQRVRATMPMCAMWDDNEVASNYAGSAAYRREPTGQFIQRRAAAYQAWWEHQPVRVGPPSEAGLRIHRAIRWGSLANLWLLDERQYRSPHVCDRLDDLPAIDACSDIDDPTRTMLGTDQEDWLADGIATSDARWEVVASQTVVADWLIEVGDISGLNHDQWDGYAPARQRLFEALVAADRALILAGDVHLGAVNNIKTPDGRNITELVTPSISSRLDDRLALGLQMTVGNSETVHHFDTEHHGYVVVDIEQDFATARFRHVDTSVPAGALEPGPAVDLDGRGTLIVSDS